MAAKGRKVKSKVPDELHPKVGGITLYREPRSRDDIVQGALAHFKTLYAIERGGVRCYGKTVKSFRIDAEGLKRWAEEFHRKPTREQDALLTAFVREKLGN